MTDVTGLVDDLPTRLRKGEQFNPGQIASHIEALQRDLAAAREDAERYRWLFSDDGNSVIARVNKVWRQWDGESSWHSAIDAARSK